MASNNPLCVIVSLKLKVSLWDALKLRLSGCGAALKHLIEMELEKKNQSEEAIP